MVLPSGLRTQWRSTTGEDCHVRLEHEENGPPWRSAISTLSLWEIFSKGDCNQKLDEGEGSQRESVTISWDPMDKFLTEKDFRKELDSTEKSTRDSCHQPCSPRRLRRKSLPASAAEVKPAEPQDALRANGSKKAFKMEAQSPGIQDRAWFQKQAWRK